jgi:toxin-antitoxin system PIN domain toxin
VILADVNVLLSAFRADAPAHEVCRHELRVIVGGPSPFAVSTLVLAGVLRIATNRRAFDPPSPLAETVQFCEDLLDQPHCVPVHPGAGHWRIFSELCRSAAAIGNLVSDAWLAALAIEHGCELITLDRDFVRFPGLRFRSPLTARS